jgi:hypothetical protein
MGGEFWVTIVPIALAMHTMVSAEMANRMELISSTRPLNQAAPDWS